MNNLHGTICIHISLHIAMCKEWFVESNSCQAWIVFEHFLTPIFIGPLITEEFIKQVIFCLAQNLGWDETNFSGRDRENILKKIHYETETEKKWMLNFFTRRDLTSKFQARPRPDRESQCLFLRDRDENQFFIKKKTVYLAKFC